MADFNVRSDSVDVEGIMRQIRARIREKRGVDYTEEQVRELASVRLEKFLDPRNLRSDLLEQFRRTRPALPAEPPPVEAPYTFDDQTLFASHRGLLRFIRRLLRPILKLFFNPNTLNYVLHTQANFNLDLLKRDERRRIEFDRSRAEWNALYYEVLHNLVIETTRTGIEVKNLRMHAESLASRLDFSERRVRALEGVVQYRPEAMERAEVRRGSLDAFEGESALNGEDGPDAAGGTSADSAANRKRRRRRRGRRPPGAPAASPDPAGAQDSGEGAPIDAMSSGAGTREQSATTDGPSRGSDAQNGEQP